VQGIPPKAGTYNEGVRSHAKARWKRRRREENAKGAKRQAKKPPYPLYIEDTQNPSPVHAKPRNKGTDSDMAVAGPQDWHIWTVGNDDSLFEALAVIEQDFALVVDSLAWRAGAWVNRHEPDFHG
jgi:hypothetical protein